MRSLGSSSGELPKVPTLRQAIRARLDFPPTNLVSLIFKPGSYNVISLICEDRFRVNVREDEPLYRDLYELFSNLVSEKLSLFVRVPDDSEGRFEILVDEKSRSEWSEYDWGFRLESHSKRSIRAGQKPRASTLKQVD